MFTLKASRISLRALSISELELLVRYPSQLRESLGLRAQPILLEEDWLEGMNKSLRDFCINGMNFHPNDPLWYTHWLILHQQDAAWIGGIGASGLPDENGEIEIGYYLDLRYRGRGYAAEAAAVFCKFFLEQPGLKRIKAHIPVGHRSSEQVVMAMGFRVDAELEEEGMQLQRWVLEKNQDFQ